MKEKPFRGLIVENLEQAKVVLMGVPYDKGCSCGKGASKAPQVLRELSSFLPPLTMDGEDISNVKIYDMGNTKSKDLAKIEIETKEMFNNEKFKLIFGGDHSIAIPLHKNFVLKCHQKNIKPVIIHIDAHPDFCDIYDGSKYSHACPNMRTFEEDCDLNNFTLIGIRGYEKQETDFFTIHPEIKIYNASFINEHGIDDMIEEIYEKYKTNCEVCISYDIDANDPSYAPGTGTPEAFGLKSIDTMKIITKLVEKLNVKCMDIVEISPALDCNNITSWLALKTIYEVFNVIKKK